MASRAGGPDEPRLSRDSRDSISSASTTSIVFDRIHETEQEKADAADRKQKQAGDPPIDDHDDDADADVETRAFLAPAARTAPPRPMDRGLRRILLLAALALVAVWLVSLAVFVSVGAYKHASDSAHDPAATSRGSGKPLTMDQLFNGAWSPQTRSLEWIPGPHGEDGLLLAKAEPGDGGGGGGGGDYLSVEHVRSAFAAANLTGPQRAALPPRTVLMREAAFEYAGRRYDPAWTSPSPDLRRVLVAVDRTSVWRHSFTAAYFVLDVASQAVRPLVPADPAARVQLATWSPRGDAIAFTMGNNLYVRRLDTGSGDDASASILQVTRDGGPECFYGVPDWVYEEEVVAGRSATWWSADGRRLAFLRTNESAVPEYTLQYFASRPSGARPAPGEESYPELQRIKYPKAGAPNPVVDLLFYDLAVEDDDLPGGPFAIPLADDFPPDDRIITNLVWAGASVLVKTTNRVGDVLKVLLVDVAARRGSAVSTVDVAAIDGGWYDVSHAMVFVPADAARGRPHDGYVDQVLHDGFQHLAYFAPLDSPSPASMLTSGPWEVAVDDAPPAVDLANNLVYFVAARESPLQRHVYSVRLLDGSGLRPLTDPSAESYYSATLSPLAGYALLHNHGPDIPSQRVVSTPGSTTLEGDDDVLLLLPPLDAVVEDNHALAERARTHQLPITLYGSLALAPNISVAYLERRPPHFDPSKRYPVLFHQYSGPGSQTVHKKFAVDFQSYAASALGYLVITIDPRGTGLRGRAHRVPVRSRLGLLEAADHIAAARLLASQRSYIDPSRLCIWGWSYGGFQALKTLEADAGATFAYGMAVAPVTDWRFYDSVYAERYMRLPGDNAAGYDAVSVHNVSALARAQRFLVMHGVADDNVHLQNSLTLLDRLVTARVENYDVHVFPDSDHSIRFHGASRVVYDKLENWLVNAFNGEWLKVAGATPASKG